MVQADEEVAPEWFERVMGLMIGLKFVPGSMDTHWVALKDVPENVLREAAKRAARTRNEFPSPYELRLDCDVVKSHLQARRPQVTRETELAKPIEWPKSLSTRLTAIGIKLPTVRREWRYYCDDCSDSGWMEHWCGDGEPPHLERNDCARISDHVPHSWVQACPCAPRNPEIQRRVLAQARYAEQRAEQGGRRGN